jgi:tetratricopeptide (TPR) repeat protein
MNNAKREISLYLENISLFVIGAFLVLLPILFLATTTDAFVLPKQIALSAAVGLFSLFFAVKTVSEGKLKIRTSPFDMSVGLLILIAFLSAVFSSNRYDALIAFVPFFFVGILYFAIVNLVKREKQLLFVLSCLTAGAVLSSVLTIFSFFKIYPLPFSYTQVQFFTTFGSLLDQALYLALVLPITGYFVYAFSSSLRSGRSEVAHTPFSTAAQERKNSSRMIGFSVSFVIIAISLGMTIYMLTTTQKPLILPFETGIQTGFAAISQDTGSVLKSIFLGSGFGTYLTDFTRFKPAAFNTNPTLWSFVFFRSSSFALELLATTGLLGLGAFLFLVFRVFKSGGLFLPLVVAVIAAFLMPFSFTIMSLFFILLAIFAVVLIHGNPDKYAESEFYLVALKKGLFALKPEGERVNLNDTEKRYSRILPVAFFLFVLTIVGVPLFYAGRLVASDLTFQKSLVAASQNNGLETYNLQNAAIQMFPYRDIYHRSFSQTNIALANSLASSQAQNKDASPSAQLQQNITTLIQQSINEGRAAVAISPLTSFNWNNLSSIYRALIGFGENADRFALATAQQAVALDPNNPQQYLDLGGLYFQLQQYDEAIRQFQIAINLKQDYANAYYNLGHALEAKRDYTNAIAAYEVVQNLVKDDKENSKKIKAEIDALKQRIASGDTGETVATESAQPTDELNVNDRPDNALPEQDNPIRIPGPSETPTPTPRGQVTPTPSL